MEQIAICISGFGGQVRKLASIFGGAEKYFYLKLINTSTLEIPDGKLFTYCPIVVYLTISIKRDAFSTVITL